MDNQQDDSGESTWKRDYAKAKEVVDRLDTVTLNIAVTGESGSGKSSFVNAIRGLKYTDKGAAPTGVIETTMEPTMYLHPTMPNVKIWDLPGIGSSKFKAKTYMKDIKCKTYDFFLIISAGRFKENDMMLAKEIKKEKKNFYFVRSKTDFDVANNGTKGVTEEATLEKIRDNCLENLRTLGSPPVFLIASHNLEKFDFQELVNTLKRDLPDEKREALLMSLPVYSKLCLDMKYYGFKVVAWAVAFISYGIALVSGQSSALDAAMVASFLTKCYNSFGLDDETLKKLSDRVNKPILAMVKESALVMAIAGKSLPTTKPVPKLGAADVMEALYSLEPVAGNVITRYVLLEGVNELYRVAKRVLEMAEVK